VAPLPSLPNHQTPFCYYGIKGATVDKFSISHSIIIVPTVFNLDPMTLLYFRSLPVCQHRCYN